MSVNRAKPHVLILPEDDANRQLANGFQLQLDWNRQRQMQVLNPVGGWVKVLEEFQSVHVVEMGRNPHRSIVLLIDFDNDERRLDKAKAAVPSHLSERVFILGTWSQPEALRAEAGSYESIGAKMAEDCREETNTIWGHKLLRHNAAEIDRLRDHARPFLFG